MQEYEVVREIFNRCSNNQMRDVFIEEVETDDPRKWIEDKVAGADVRIEESVADDGTVVFEVIVADLLQRFSFSPL